MDPFAFRPRRYRVLWAIRRAAAAVDIPHLYSISFFLLAGRNKKSICELVGPARSLV